MEDKQNKPKDFVTFEFMNTTIIEMLKDPHKLSQGHKFLSQYEKCPGFYISLLKIVFLSEPNSQKSLIKLSSSILLNYLRNNWSDENYITLEEKMEIFTALTVNMHHKDYFLKNFVAKLLGIISAKEWPNSYEMLIKKILKGLSENKDEESNDRYLTIIICILNECDDRIALMTSELLPIVIDSFKNSTVSYYSIKNILLYSQIKKIEKNASKS